MAIQIFPAAGGTADFDGIFIPRTDLAPGGLSSDDELDVAEDANVKRDKSLYAFMYVVASTVNALAPLDKLGVDTSVPNLNSTSHAISISTQRFVKENTDLRLDAIPVPSIGANSGRGDIALTDIFPNAVKTANAATVATSGMLIESAPLSNYGAPVHASIDLTVDSRLLMHTMFKDFASDTVAYPSRTAVVASAVTARSLGTSGEVAIPAAYTASTDPTSGLVAADLPITHILSSGNVALTFNTAATISASGVQSWEINSVTA